MDQNIGIDTYTSSSTSLVVVTFLPFLETTVWPLLERTATLENKYTYETALDQALE
jgi:hypothetical protein